MKLQLIIRRAPATAGLGWLQQGWGLFRQSAGLWILQVMIIYLLTLFGALHPVLGAIVAFIGPFLSAGLYRNIVAAQSGKPVTIDNLFHPLKDAAVRPILLRIGAAGILCSLPVSILASEVLQQAQAGSVDLLQLSALVLGLGLSAMFFAYAVAIAYFLQEQRLLMVLQASFIACWRNMTPLSLYGLIAILLISTGVPTMFLSWLLVMPLLSISFFISFTEFFALKPVTDADDTHDDPSNGPRNKQQDDQHDGDKGYLEV